MLERSDGTDRERALDELDGMIREPAEAHFALAYEFVQRSPRLLDRRIWIRVVELQQVDVVEPQTLQTSFEVAADAVRPEILAIRKGPALREDEGVVAPTGNRAPDELLCSSPAVERRGIDPVHAEIERGVDGADGVTLVVGW